MTKTALHSFQIENPTNFPLLHFLLPLSALGNSNSNQKLTKSFCPLFPPSLSNQYFSFFYSLLACVLCAYNKYHTAKSSILYTHTQELKTNLCIFRKLQASILSHSNREAQKKVDLFFSFLFLLTCTFIIAREGKGRKDYYTVYNSNHILFLHQTLSQSVVISPRTRNSKPKLNRGQTPSLSLSLSLYLSVSVSVSAV